MSEIGELNRRKLKNIKNEIILFENKSISLFELINNLDGLYRSMQTWDQTWDDEFFQKWLNLESIYAGMVNRNSSTLDQVETDIIDQSIVSIDELVSNALTMYCKTRDSTVVNAATIIDDIWLLCPDCNDAWMSSSEDAMIICPKCNHALHNPRYHEKKSASPRVTNANE